MTKQLFERDLTDEEEEEVLAQFAALDPEKKGQIEWSDFLYHESLSVLQKFRTEVMWDNKFSCVLLERAPLKLFLSVCLRNRDILKEKKCVICIFGKCCILRQCCQNEPHSDESMKMTKIAVLSLPGQ